MTVRKLRGGTDADPDVPIFDLTKMRSDVEGMRTPKNGKPAASSQNNDAAKTQTTNTNTEPAKVQPAKLSLRDLLHQTVKDADVKELGEKLGEAQFKPEDIQEYVSLRRDINLLPGMCDEWAAQSWEEQTKVLALMAKKSKGMAKTVAAINQFHANEFLKETLDQVMRQFEVPLQTVDNLLQFKNFLDQAARADLVEVIANPKHQPENGIAILADLGDHTNQDELTYLPRKGSKVAHDAWVVVQEKHQEMEVTWQEFEKLRSLATHRLTPFKVSNRNDRHGLSGKLFTMGGSGNWAVLLNIHNNNDDRKIASIVGYVGLEEKDIPAPNCADWNHRGHCLFGAENSDTWMMINTALEELNSRQHARTLVEMEKSKNDFGALKQLATMPCEPKEQGLHKILEGEERITTICLQNFMFRKKNGKVKEGYFGIAIKCEANIPLLVEVKASECFCFPKDLVGKKIPFQWSYNQKDQLEVKMDVRGFCQENQIRGRLDNSWWEGMRMLSNILRRRLKREDDLYEGDDEEDTEDLNENSDEDLAKAEAEAELA